VALRAVLTPEARQHPGLDLAGRLEPAEGVLAGDWFDVVPLGPDRVALVVGDVAGHGPAPAVFALRLQGSLASALVAGADPAQALAAVTTLLGETGELFASVFIAVVDLTGQCLAYANAGHPPAVLTVGGRGRPMRTVALPLTGPIVSGPPLAGGWQTVSHPFRAGDLLLIYTDGLTEARDGSGQEFGLGRIRSVVAGHRGDMDELVSRLGDDVGSHTRTRLTDDVTVLACRRTLTDAPLAVGVQGLTSARGVP
jgi:sigma-B regulation protein RsbU (phosphoserine phosphatase)